MASRTHGTQLLLLEPTDAKPTPPRRPRVAAREATPPARPPLVEQHELPLVTSTAVMLEEARAMIERRLRATLSVPVRVAVTDNRRTMLSVRREGNVRHVRVHHMFVSAPPEVFAALGRYFTHGDRFASKIIDRYIAANQDRIRAVRPERTRALVTRGAVHDLEEIQKHLSREYFDGALSLAITWGQRTASRRRPRRQRTIRMGTYFITEQLIRIHPALDQAFVPREFVEWVVYHEMLHHVVPMPMVNGRRVFHSDEFRRREKLYLHYPFARDWEQLHLAQLIASRRVVAVR